MFDIGFFEIVFIAVVALLVLGPEKMPHAVRMCAAYWGRLKRNMIATKIELEEQLAVQDIKRQLQREQEKVQQLIEQQEIELSTQTEKPASAQAQAKNLTQTQQDQFPE